MLRCAGAARLPYSTEASYEAFVWWLRLQSPNLVATLSRKRSRAAVSSSGKISTPSRKSKLRDCKGGVTVRRLLHRYYARFSRDWHSVAVSILVPGRPSYHGMRHHNAKDTIFVIRTTRLRSTAETEAQSRRAFT